MPAIRSAHLFYRQDNHLAKEWAVKLEAVLKNEQVVSKKDSPDLVVALGGDGTILEAARQFAATSIILGLNLGTFGFLAATSKEEDFNKAIKQVAAGKYSVSERSLLLTQVLRKKKVVEEQLAVNDIVITSPLNMVQLNVEIDSYSYQYIKGSGVLISTPTGSTAYNISAHGPILEPTLDAIIVNELLDHNIPTPPLVVNGARKIKVVISDFRKHQQIKLTSSNKPADVVLSSDGAVVFPLEKGDEVCIEKSAKTIRFVELDNHHFFSSLRNKFAIE